MTETVEDVKLDEKISLTTEEPQKFKVIMLNDTSTPMDFVTSILCVIFKHTNETSKKIMLTIHDQGSGVAGIYSYEIAEQKSVEAMTRSRNNGFPLQIKLEED